MLLRIFIENLQLRCGFSRFFMIIICQNIIFLPTFDNLSKKLFVKLTVVKKLRRVFYPYVENKFLFFLNCYYFCGLKKLIKTKNVTFQ